MPEERLPKDFGKYRLVRRIATGGMAEIFLAHERREPDVPIVIKRILPHLVQSTEFMSMFFDEARIAANLDHTNIVRIFDVGRVDGAYFMAMEYVHGEDIRRIYNKAYKLQRSLPLSHSIRVIAESAHGLGYAHKLTDPLTGEAIGVVHRDVSPQNILVTYEGGVKIVDFGIAKAATKVNETRAGVLKGKYSYMSPEQATGDPIDQRTDIFALGIILYETTTGTRLFKRHNELATLQAIMKCHITPPSDALHGYPVELEAIVMKALSKDPADRYQRAEDFGDQLFEFLRRSGLYVEPVAIAGFMRDLFADELEEHAEEDARLQEHLESIGEDLPEAESNEVQILPEALRPETPRPVMADTRTSEGPRPAEEPQERADAADPASVVPPGFVDEADISTADGTVSEDERADLRPSTAVQRPPKVETISDRPPAEESFGIEVSDTSEDNGTDEAPTVAAAPVYKTSQPALRVTTVPTTDPVEHTDKVRAHRPKKSRPSASKGNRRPKVDRRNDPTIVRPQPAVPAKRALSPAIILGIALLVLAVVVLAGVAIERTTRNPSSEREQDPVAAAPAQPAPPTDGTVSVVTVPGAMISVNERVLGRANAQGEAGPFELPAGRIVLRVAHTESGFERRRAVKVSAGTRHEFELAARQGSLRVHVEPWAKVRIDGREVGITPLTDLALVEGTHHIELENPDIKRRHDTLVRVEAGQLALLKVNLSLDGEPL